MVDKDLINNLHEEKIIDKRYVFWWQLGFEGRRIFTEEEFQSGLTTVKWNIYINRQGDREERKFRLWTGKDVPILVRNVDINGSNVPCFISIKPASHWPQLDMSPSGEKFFGPGMYETPHIRGVAAETTDRHFFWYPFYVEDKNEYDTLGGFIKGSGLPFVASPVSTPKFYRNLIERLRRRGKRAQQKPINIDYVRRGFTAVPYFDFDPAKSHITFYPVNLSHDRLDTPGVIASQSSGSPKIIGAGYPSVREHYYGDVLRRD